MPLLPSLGNYLAVLMVKNPVVFFNAKRQSDVFVEASASAMGKAKAASFEARTNKTAAAGAIRTLAGFSGNMIVVFKICTIFLQPKGKQNNSTRSGRSPR